MYTESWFYRERVLVMVLAMKPDVGLLKVEFGLMEPDEMLVC